MPPRRSQGEVAGMIPGLSSRIEGRILGALTAEATAVTPDRLAALDFALMNGRDPEARALGIEVVAGPDVAVVVTDPSRPVGHVRIGLGGPGSLLFIDNRAWTGTLTASIRVMGTDCAILINDIGPAGFVAITDLLLRSDLQFLFWGVGATAVGCSIEIEGEGHGVVVGDDALISNGVWMRNYNMHALVDLTTSLPIGRPPVTTVIERHVWLGQDALLLNCARVGMGSVIGARSLVNAPVPARVIAAGSPARVIREHVSWGRDTYEMSVEERRLVTDTQER